MSLTGQIEEMGLGAVIQTLSLNRYRGTLRIETEDAGSQFFFISEGAIVLVRQVKRDPVRMGDLLIRAGKITERDLEQALQQQKETGLRLGEQLVANGLVDQDQIERVIQAKFEEDFLDLFLLDKGRFEFIFGLTPEALFAPDEKLERVTLNTSGLMLEAMRRVDEWQDMITSLGSLDTIFSNQRHAPSQAVLEQRVRGINLPVEARKRLYGLLDGELSLREILGQAISQRIASRLETFLFLHHLCESKQVQPLDPRTLLTHARSALSAKDVPKAAKFIRAILGRKGELEIGLIKRYLAFLRKNRRPRLAFDEARMFGGQALARGETKQAIALYEEAVALEYRDLEVIDRLFYALLRDNQRQRAIEVGLMLRDYMGADADLQLASRVVRNLKELDPENPEVLELSGLVLKRKEQNEQAVRELEHALQRADASHPRRAQMVAALLELVPNREDLRAEQESIEVREAREAVRREFRRRMVLVSLVPTTILLLLIGSYLGYYELEARSKLARAQEIWAAGPDPDYANFREARELLTTAQVNGWLVRGEVEQLKGKIDASIADFERQRQASLDVTIRERQAEEETRRRDEQQRLRTAQLGASLAEYRLYVSRRDWAKASAQAHELLTEYRPEEDPRLADVRYYVELTSQPSGATVLSAGKPAGETPLAIPARPGEELDLELRASGYRPLQRQVKVDGYEKLNLELKRGPSWRVSFPEPPLPPRAWSRGLVVAVPAGRVASLNLADGGLQWALETRDAFNARGVAVPRQLSWLALAGGRLVCGGGGSLLCVDLDSGAVRWARAVPGRGQAWGCAFEHDGHALVALVQGAQLTLLDCDSGEVRDELDLPAGGSAPPVPGGGRLFVPLDNGALVAIRADGGPLSRSWLATDTGAQGAPVFMPLIASVLLRGKSTLLGLEAGDGRRFELNPRIGPLCGMTVADDRAYALTQAGTLAGLRVPDGQLLVPATQVAGSVAAGPLLLGGELFLVDGQGLLVRLDRDGRPQGTPIPLGARVTAPLVAAPDERVVAVTDRTVLLIDPR